MKRLALVLAAVVLGTGCIFVDDDDSCDSQRHGGLDLPELPRPGHARAARRPASTSVDIYVNDRYVDDVSLLGPAATIFRIARGATLVRVDAVDLSAGGSGAHRATGTSSASTSATCGNHAVAAQPAEALLDLNYAATCPSGPCYLWFSLFDELAGSVATRVDGATAPTTYVCPADVTFLASSAGRFTARLDAGLVDAQRHPARRRTHTCAALCAPLDLRRQRRRDHGRSRGAPPPSTSSPGASRRS